MADQGVGLYAPMHEQAGQGQLHGEEGGLGETGSVQQSIGLFALVEQVLCQGPAEMAL